MSSIVVARDSENPRASRWRRDPRLRVVAVPVLFGLYAALFFALKGGSGSAVEALVVLPVAAAGILGGIRVGVAAGLLSFPLNLMLLTLSGPESVGDLFGAGAAARHVLVIVVGAASGYLAVLSRRLLEQTTRRRRAQDALAGELLKRRALVRISRVIGSSLELEEAYGAFAELVAGLLPHDRLLIMLIERSDASARTVYAAGTGARAMRQREPWPVAGSLLEMTVKAGAGIRVGAGGSPAVWSAMPELSGGLLSAIAAPLRSRGSFTGALALASAEPCAYGDGDLALLEEIAAQVANALANSELHSEVEHRAREAGMLADAARAVTAAQTLGAMSEELHVHLESALRFDHFEVALYDRTTGWYQVRFARGVPADGLGEGESVALVKGGRHDRAWLGEPPGAGSRAGYALPPVEERLAAAGMSSWILAPLHARGVFIGALTIALKPPGRYRNPDVKLLERVALQVAPAIDNAVAREVERELFARLEGQNWDLLQARASLQEAARELQTKNDALQAANDAKTTFLSMVSHELSTPLTIVNGFAELLLANTGGNLSDEQLKYLQVMQRNGLQLARLVNDLLDKARLESGRFGLEFGEFDGIEMIDEIVRGFEAVAGRKGQSIVTDYPARAVRVQADRDRLSQVVTNLISNASKYSDEGSRIQVCASGGDGWFTVAVEDEGGGITEADQQKLFTSFFRAAEHRSQNISGTGLGLVIARSIIEMHGGRISVESEYGKGTTFRLRVPLAQAGFGHGDGPQGDEVGMIARPDDGATGQSTGTYGGNGRWPGY